MESQQLPAEHLTGKDEMKIDDGCDCVRAFPHSTGVFHKFSSLSREALSRSVDCFRCLRVVKKGEIMKILN